MFKTDMSQSGERLIVLSLLTTLGGSLLQVVAIVINLWFLPRGDEVRPGALAIVMVLIALLSGIASVVRAVAGIWRGRNRAALVTLGVVAMLLSLAPLFVGKFFLLWVVARHHLRLLD
jgi:hypothetical protein